jgi:hypothetical protein
MSPAHVMALAAAAVVKSASLGDMQFQIMSARAHSATSQARTARALVFALPSVRETCDPVEAGASLATAVKET